MNSWIRNKLSEVNFTLKWSRGNYRQKNISIWRNPDYSHQTSVSRALLSPRQVPFPISRAFTPALNSLEGRLCQEAPVKTRRRRASTHLTIPAEVSAPTLRFASKITTCRVSNPTSYYLTALVNR